MKRFFNGSIFILRQQRLCQGKGKNFSLVYGQSFDMKILFRVIVPSVNSIPFNRSIQKVSHIFNITLDCSGRTFQFFCNATGRGKTPWRYLLVNKGKTGKFELVFSVCSLHQFLSPTTIFFWQYIPPQRQIQSFCFLSAIFDDSIFFSHNHH